MQDEKSEKLKYIALILDGYFKREPYMTEQRAGALFDKLYEINSKDLKIYYNVYK